MFVIRSEREQKNPRTLRTAMQHQGVLGSNFPAQLLAIPAMFPQNVAAAECLVCLHRNPQASRSKPQSGVLREDLNFRGFHSLIYDYTLALTSQIMAVINYGNYQFSTPPLFCLILSHFVSTKKSCINIANSSSIRTSPVSS